MAQQAANVKSQGQFQNHTIFWVALLETGSTLRVLLNCGKGKKATKKVDPVILVKRENHSWDWTNHNKPKRAISVTLSLFMFPASSCRQTKNNVATLLFRCFLLFVSPPESQPLSPSPHRNFPSIWSDHCGDHKNKSGLINRTVHHQFSRLPLTTNTPMFSYLAFLSNPENGDEDPESWSFAIF